MSRIILLVEPNPDLRELFTVCLEWAGQIIYAGTVVAARDCIQRQDNIQLAVINTSIPIGRSNLTLEEDEAGFYVAKGFREKYPDVPIVFNTCSRDKNLVEKISCFDRAGLLLLPFAYEELKRIVELILKVNRSQTQKINCF